MIELYTERSNRDHWRVAITCFPNLYQVRAVTSRHDEYMNLTLYRLLYPPPMKISKHSYG